MPKLYGRRSEQPSANHEQLSLSKADEYRDRGAWIQAADAYRKYLEGKPTDAAAWIQLGNMEKEAERFDQAEAAYRQAMELAPENPEPWIQLASAHRRRGSHKSAIEALIEANTRAPAAPEPVRQLIELGAADQINPHRFDIVASTGLISEQLASIRKQLDRLEGFVAPFQHTTAWPIEAYPAFRATFDISQPDHGALTGADSAPEFLMLQNLDLERELDCIRMIRSRLNQSWPKFKLAVASQNPEMLSELQRIAEQDARLLVVDSLLDAAHEHQSWLLASQPGCYLHEHALAWMAVAILSKAPAAIFSDTDTIQFESDFTQSHSQPEIRSRFDDILIKEGMDFGPAIAFSERAVRTLGRTALGQLVNQEITPTDALRVATSDEKDRVIHIPQAVISRIQGTLQASPTNVRSNTAGHPSPSRKICLIVPTRDQRTLLRNCLNSHLQRAKNPDLISVIVVNNQSREKATLKYLDAISGPNIQIVDDNRAFNWARINNMACAQTDAEILVFANNDTEMLTDDWDLAIDRQLNDKRVGAIGAKLNYPNGTIQHAGIVLGAGHLVAHEGTHMPSDAQGPWRRWNVRRQVSAVTGAFIATTRAAHEAVGGFDEQTFPVNFGDVDYCLKLRESGLRVIYDPNILLTHHESATRGARKSSMTTQAAWLSDCDQFKSRWQASLNADPFTSPVWQNSLRPVSCIHPLNRNTIMTYIQSQ